MGNYFLVSKTLGIPYSSYRGNALRISDRIPAIVDEIVIGLKNNTNHQNRLVTFKDSAGNVIERCYNFFGKPYKNFVYSREENVIGEDEFVESVSRKEYTMQRRHAPLYNKKARSCGKSRAVLKMLWKKRRSLTNHLSQNIYNGNKILSQSEIEYNQNLNTQIHCFTEYPEIINGKKSGKRKDLAFAVTPDGHKILPHSEIMSEGVVFPKEDTFLPYRALEVDDSKMLLAERAIADRGLSNMEIQICPDHVPKGNEENYQAFFDNWRGTLCFNKTYPNHSKAKVANTAYHEAEHGWQYYLDARYSKGGTPWYNILFGLFGPLTSKKQIKEAKTYTQSIDNYIEFNGKNSKEYRTKNYIEICGFRAGDAAQKAYEEQRETIQSNFKHIPKELL